MFVDLGLFFVSRLSLMLRLFLHTLNRLLFDNVNTVDQTDGLGSVLAHRSEQGIDPDIVFTARVDE